MTKTIFITGASSGFGKATAELFASHGWNVAATYRNPEAADMFRHLKNIKMYKLEVTDDREVSDVSKQTIADFGSIDVLVNNAGYCLMGSLEGSTMTQIRSQFETNTIAVIAVTKAFIPHFRTRNSGMIFNISSASAIANYPFISAYGASKWAVRGLSETLAIELAPFNIKVKTIFPGFHATAIFLKLDSAVGPGSEFYIKYMDNFRAIRNYVTKGGNPEQVAQTIWKAVQKNDSKRDYLVNRDAKILALMKRFMSDKQWIKMNVGTITHKPTRFMGAFANWQVNGTQESSVVMDKKLTQQD